MHCSFEWNSERCDLHFNGHVLIFFFFGSFSLFLSQANFSFLFVQFGSVPPTQWVAEIHHRKRSHFDSLWNGFNLFHMIFANGWLSAALICLLRAIAMWILPNTIQKICVPNSVLFHDVFDIVRFKCFTKFFTCQKVFELHKSMKNWKCKERVVGLIGFSFKIFRFVW